MCLSGGTGSGGEFGGQARSGSKAGHWSDEEVRMRIEKDQFVGGLPARDVRGFMRSAAGKIIRTRTVAQQFGLSSKKAEHFLNELENQGLISPKEDYWEATAKGYAFAMATAAKPLRKSTAEQLVGETIGRAELVNADYQVGLPCSATGPFSEAS